MGSDRGGGIENAAVAILAFALIYIGNGALSVSWTAALGLAVYLLLRRAVGVSE